MTHSALATNTVKTGTCDVCGTNLANHENSRIPDIGDACTECYEMWLEYTDGDERYDQYK
jgi:hypothetical protein